MADITQIQVGSTTYDIRDGKHTVFVVKGTQVAKTNAWTGDLTDIDALYDGLTINYWLPFAGTSTAATLELTLKNGTSGAIPVYAGGTDRMTTHQPEKTYNLYVYQTITINSNSYTGWWMQRSYNTNTTYDYFSNLGHANGNFVADSAIYRYQLLFHRDADTLTPLNNNSNATGTNKTMLTNVTFDPFGEIFYYNSTTTVNANAAIGSGACNYSRGGIDLRYTFNCGSTLTAHKDIYMKISMQSDGSCKIADANPLTHTLPLTNDGYHYLYLGRTYSTYQMSLYPSHPIYYHDGTSLRKLEKIDNATSANAGLMSAADKTKLDALDTSYAPLSHTHGNITNTGTITSDTAVANGDKIIVSDSSDSSKLIRTGISFDGSTTTKGLTPKGTWESFAAASHNHAAGDITSGTLSAARGGTGQDTLTKAGSAIINALGEGSSPAQRDDYIVAQYAGGGTTTTTYHRRKLSNIFKALNSSDITTALGFTPANIASPAFSGTPTAPTAPDGTNSTQIATTAFVQSAFKANDAMIFKGTIGSSGATVTTLPATHYQGWTYKVATAGTYAGQSCEIGDTIMCITDGTSANDAHWTIIQANIDGAVTGPASATDTHVATFSGTSGKIIQDSGFTIGKSVPSDAKFTDTTYSNGNGISLSGTTFSAAFPSSGTPAALGTASNGSANTVARSDHVHAKPAYGNITTDGAITSDTAVANGDKIIVADSSASSKLIRTGISFDGSTTTKALTPKGTWESFAAASHSHTSLVPTQLGNDKDLNTTWSDNTAWYYAAGNNTVANNPVTSGEKAFGMLMFRTATGYRRQIVFSYDNSNQIYTRVGASTDNWSAWTQWKLTDTTYTQGTGISISGTTISNSGVRSIATGSANGTISVNTNGTSADVSVKGLGSAAYTDSSAYSASGHDHDSTYLKLSGGTMTGDLKFSNVNSGTTRQIQFTVGGNDYGRIAGSATASNAGYIEISTADDGNEPIYARQYTGVYSTLKRTATLLDESGNTDFPGNVNAVAHSISNNITLQWNSTDESLDFVFA